jgi:hypothetical protein
MLSEHDRVVLDEIEHELSEADPLLAAEFAQWRPRGASRSWRTYCALVSTAALLLVLGVLLTLPGMFWTGAFVLSSAVLTRRWWPHSVVRDQ